MPELQDMYLLISYQQLDSLLTAAKELPQLKKDLSRCHEQLEACRTIQMEILDKYRELEDMM